MSTAYKEGDFHWVLYEGNWTIAKFILSSKKLGEKDDNFNEWFRFLATYGNRQMDFQEIDPEPIKRKESGETGTPELLQNK